jgi:hypothetical protein
MTEENYTANGGEGQESSPGEQVATAGEGQSTPQPVTEPAKAETSKGLADQQNPETKETKNDTYGFDDLFPKEVTTPMDDGEKTMVPNFLKWQPRKGGKFLPCHRFSFPNFPVLSGGTGRHVQKSIRNGKD